MKTIVLSFLWVAQFLTAAPPTSGRPSEKLVLQDGCSEKFEKLTDDRYRLWSIDGEGRGQGPYTEWVLRDQKFHKVISGFMNEGKREGKWWELANVPDSPGHTFEIHSQYSSGRLEGDYLEKEGERIRVMGHYLKGKPYGAWIKYPQKDKMPNEISVKIGEKSYDINIQYVGHTGNRPADVWATGPANGAPLRMGFYENGRIKFAGNMYPSDVIGPYQKLNGTLVTFHQNGLLEGIEVTDLEGTVILEVEWNTEGRMTSESSGHPASGVFRKNWSPKGKLTRDTKVTFNGSGENPSAVFTEVNGAGEAERQYEYNPNEIIERTYYPGGLKVLTETTYDNNHLSILRTRAYTPDGIKLGTE